ncbi:MAG: response regulator [Myxococcales bacterium]|nr:response regulator [Myxococcales bacterium]
MTHACPESDWFNNQFAGGSVAQVCPQAYETRKQVAASTKSDDSQTGMRVLIVDDSPTNLCVTGATLESMGCQVTSAEGGSQALEHLEKGSFDLVLIDYHMPNMSGPELAAMIRQRMEDRAPRMIALTAGRSPEILRTCRAAGMQLVLNKPVPRNQMKLLVDRLSEQA